MTRLGFFENKVGTNNTYKIAQIFGDFFGYFEKWYFVRKMSVTTFWATFGDYWAIFIQHLVTLGTNEETKMVQNYIFKIGSNKKIKFLQNVSGRNVCLDGSRSDQDLHILKGQ